MRIEPNPNAALRHQLVLQRKTRGRVQLRNRGSLVLIPILRLSDLRLPNRDGRWT
jgi:hypothetical protein